MISLRSKWPLLFSAMLVPLFVSYYFYIQSANLSDRTIFKMVYGILNITIILFLFLYIVRKNTYRYRVGSTQSWLQAHIYFGIISFILIFMHSGFRLTGIFTTFLLVLFLLVFISGIIGTLIYNTVPLSLTKYGRDVKTEDEIISKMEHFLEEADRLVSNTSDEFKTIYKEKIRPFFHSKRIKWEYLFAEEREIINKRRNMIESYKDEISAQDIYDLNLLSSILIQKEKLYFMQAKTRIQGAWLSFHVPLTTTLLTAIVVHIWSIIYY